jgi:tRNA dimethylallyltransferase
VSVSTITDNKQDNRQDARAPDESGQASLAPIIALVGPTASGKSALGIELALRLGGEIINCDSVQVYREIEIATAKVPPSERRGVPHHLIDFVPPELNYTAADWARAAAEKIKEIEARHQKVFLVGGTGFYLRALRQPFFPSPATDEKLRARLTRLRNTRGPEQLHRVLRRFDPAEAEKLHARDWPRVQRAIEFRLQTGDPISRERPLRPEPPPLAARLRVIALNPPRQELYARINERTDKHFANGLVAEVERLLEEGVPAHSNALGAHGYRRVVEYLKSQRDLKSAIEKTRLDVRHYAKRQLSWFRHEPGVEWLGGFGDDAAVQALAFELLRT